MTNPAPATSPPAKKREWAPRIWEGMNFVAWCRLLCRNRFAVHWSCLYIAVIITLISLLHSLLQCIQAVVYGWRVRRTQIEHPPLFIIGHWRTGTTLLHELLVLDSRHAFPTTYECVNPNHFLLTETFSARWLRFLVPKHRPMDNMRAGFGRPQEDEFALCMLGAGSPYLRIAFPNRAPLGDDFLDLEGLSPSQMQRWKSTFLRFLTQITYRNTRRLVLKSPPHTCRIKVLKELFPGAKFVHIVRDPFVVFPSTVNLWKTLYRTHGLQRPTFDHLEEHVFETGLRLYQRLEETRGLVAPSHFYELRYEDLVRDPIGQVQALYEHLGLGEFDTVRPALEQYFASVAGYETNKYQVTPEQRAEIARRWATIIERYGYSTCGAPAAVSGARASGSG